VQKRIWKDALIGYINKSIKETKGATSVYICASNENTWKYGGDETKRWPIGYALNGDIFWCEYTAPLSVRSSAIKNPAGIIFLTETRLDAPDMKTWMIDGSGGGDWRFSDSGKTKGWYTSHTKNVNFVFCDGHAKSYRLQQTLSDPQMWDPKLGGNALVNKIPYLAPEYR
jgi:prepilin-type processing-associated H-X9-DG protein